MVIDLTRQEFSNGLKELDYPSLIFGKVFQAGLGRGDVTKKLLKYKKIKSLITYELDGSVIEQVKNKVGVKSSRHKIVRGDANKHLDKFNKDYDFIIIDIPDSTHGYGIVRTAGWNVSMKRERGMK